MKVRIATPGRRLATLLCAGLLAAFAAGCQTDSSTATPPVVQAPPSTAPQASHQPTTLAFEPIVGIPESRAAVLATELGSGAADKSLPVVGRDNKDVRFRIKGYFSAAAGGGQTRVSYVWDIFDASGARVHRIAGSESVPAALPDPWSAVPDDTLQAIARSTVEALRGWIDSGAPTTAVAGEMPPTGSSVATALGPASGTRAGLVETSVMASGRSSRILDVTALDTGGASAPAAALPPPPRFTYFISAVEGATGDGAQALAVALSAQLELAGGARVAEAADADYLIAGEATITPPSRGKQTVAIIWSVADSAGKELGSVRQIAHFAQGSLDRSWGDSADNAAVYAAPGVLALMPDM